MKIKVKDFVKMVKPYSNFHLIEKDGQEHCKFHYSNYFEPEKRKKLIKQYGNRYVEWFDCISYLDSSIAIMMESEHKDEPKQSI